MYFVSRLDRVGMFCSRFITKRHGPMMTCLSANKKSREQNRRHDRATINRFFRLQKPSIVSLSSFSLSPINARIFDTDQYDSSNGDRCRKAHAIFLNRNISEKQYKFIIVDISIQILKKHGNIQIKQLLRWHNKITIPVLSA